MRGQYTIQANVELRKELKGNNLSLWQLGAALGVSEGTVVRWLREELPSDKKLAIRTAIAQLIGGVRQ